MLCTADCTVCTVIDYVNYDEYASFWVYLSYFTDENKVLTYENQASKMWNVYKE